MEFKVKSVSKAELGQLRPPSQADIQRSSAKAARNPAQQKAHAQAMARIDKAAMQFVAMKQQEKQVTVQPQPSRAAMRQEPVKTPVRHHSVTRAGYGDSVAQNTKGRARTPEHVAIQRSTQNHIQRNVQREAQRERFRQVGQQAKAKVAGMVQQVSRAARNIVPSSLGQAQSELVGKQKMQSMNQHREQVRDKAKGKETGREKSKERASVQIAVPARQPQQAKGKEQDRGRSR